MSAINHSTPVATEVIGNLRHSAGCGVKNPDVFGLVLLNPERLARFKGVELRVETQERNDLSAEFAGDIDHIPLRRPRLISSSRRQAQGQQSKNDDGSTHCVAPPEYPYFTTKRAI